MKRLIGAAALCLSLTATAFADPTATGGTTTTPARKEISQVLKAFPHGLACSWTSPACKSQPPGQDAHSRVHAGAAPTRQVIREHHPVVRTVAPVYIREHAAPRHNIVDRHAAQFGRFRR